MVNGAFNSLLGFSMIIGPIVGSSLDDAFGFRPTMTFLAAINLIYTITYFVCADGLSSFKKTYRNYTTQIEETVE